MRVRKGEAGISPARFAFRRTAAVFCSACIRFPGRPFSRISLHPLFPLLLLSFLTSACATRVPAPPPRATPHLAAHVALARPPVPDKVIVQKVAYLGGPRTVYHQVGPGESVWRISRMYGVSPESIYAANRLRRGKVLQIGQRLVIPNVRSIRYVINLYRNPRWKYIIVHHTGTDEGDAITIHRAHLQRGFWNGLGYDFVIDNGTLREGDGQIEMSPRWIRQQVGAHCKADDMNEKGIGIALVGNFDYERPTPDQLRSLAYLIFILRHYYHIPPENVLGHGEVPGAKTDCPGKLFPMAFLRRAARR